MTRALETASFPFPGASLIEASAGTGKTYTIAALYLRLVLGHGVHEGGAEDAQPVMGFDRPLIPSQILVMTFTEAATRELRDRIRARLSEAARFFARSEGVPGDDLLHALRATWPEARWPALARRLSLAAQAMDEAAVMTIHGWCKRMLGEHAFDTGSHFGRTLVTDPQHWRLEAARDYWRTFVYPLSADQARRALATADTPDALLEKIGRLLSRPLLHEAGPSPSELVTLYAERLGALKRDVRPRLLAFVEWIRDRQQQKRFKGLRPDYLDDWLAQLLAWLDDPFTESPFKSSVAAERLSRVSLIARWQGSDAFDGPDPGCVDDLQAELRALPDIARGLLSHAAHWIAARVASEHERLGQMDFDQLLTGLDSALQGPGGARLAQTIRRQFPVALVDEFQDTDPIQYRIFKAIYGAPVGPDQTREGQSPADGLPAAAEGAGGAASRTALILIGDPKQAIYGFRGADIHTYLEARADTEGQHYTLGTNHRSSKAMVEAVNRLFVTAETRPLGAFRVRRADGQRLPFESVAARGRRESWIVEGAPGAALTCWVVDAGAKDSKRAIIHACADRIAELLTQGAEGRTGFAAADGTVRPLQPADIAVLVNHGYEAADIRRALTQRGLRSVYLSENESVFQSPVAAQVSAWLKACAEPDQARLLRSALATDLLGLSWAELDRIQHDDLVLEQELLRFRSYHEEWRQRGVLATLRRLMVDFDLPRRLLGTGDERSLTDLLHLSELLQQAEEEVDGELALCRHLDEQRAAPPSSDAEDARRQRLESDEHLVTVVTVHKSKGLEYPLVFLPFADSARMITVKHLPWIWHDSAGQVRVAFKDDPSVKAAVLDEQLAEDLRKLYVALTRARFATWVGLGGASKGKGGPPNAAASLIADAETTSDWADHLGHLGLGTDELAIEAVKDDPSATPVRAPAERPGAGLTLSPTPRMRDAPQAPWWVASFSGLLPGGDARWEPAEDEAGGSFSEGADVAAADPIGSGAGDAAAQGPGSDDPGLRADDEPSRTEQSAGDARQGVWIEESMLAAGSADLLGAAGSGAKAQGIHAFPRGAEIGSLLHGLLQHLGEQGFDRAREDEAIARQWLERRQRLLPDPADRALLLGQSARWLDTQLLPAATDGRAATLATFPSTQIELEFWIDAPAVDVGALDRLVRRATLDGAPRRPIASRQLRGMLKGFIDLVFEHDGRFHVLDYKSNWLGPSAAHYTPSALREAMLVHRYDLQAVLYQFALHRLLSARLPDYDYERHVGGALYWFLRGAEGPGAGVLSLRPDAALMAGLDALFAATHVEAGA